MTKKNNENKIVIKCPSCKADHECITLVMNAQESHPIMSVEGSDVYVSSGDTEYSDSFLYCDRCGYEWGTPTKANIIYG